MGKGSSGTNTVETSSQPPAAVLAQYQNLIGQSNQVAQTPYTTGGFNASNMIQGFSPDQLASFNTVDQSQGTAQPYYNQAQTMLNSSQAPVTAGVQSYNPTTMAQYANPYEQQAVGATEAQIQNTNAQQQEQVVGNAVSSGAWGGDRSAVAQSELAGQQATAENSTIANMENTGFNQQQGEFNTEQQEQLGANEAQGWLGTTGAGEESGLGTTAENTALTGANAQEATGSLQQQLGQEQLNVPYEQFQAEQAYPFQTLQYNADISEGLGGSEGGTGTTTSPAPNGFSQDVGTAAGLGTLGYLGYLAFEKGGAVPKRARGGFAPQHFDAGGGAGGVTPGALPVTAFESQGAPGVGNVNIGTPQMQKGVMGPPKPPSPFNPPANNGLQNAVTGIGAIQQGIANAPPAPPSTLPWPVNTGAPSSDLSATTEIGDDDFSKGGFVPRHYDDGGSIGLPTAQSIGNTSPSNNATNQFLNMTTEQLQQLNARSGGRNPMIQMALQRKQMTGGTAQQPQQAGMAPMAAQAQGAAPPTQAAAIPSGAQPQSILQQQGMAKGGFVPQHLDGSDGSVVLPLDDSGNQTPIPSSSPAPSDLPSTSMSPMQLQALQNINRSAPQIAGGFTPQAANNNTPPPTSDAATGTTGMPSHDDFMKQYNAEVANAAPYNKPDPMLALLSTMGAIGSGRSSKFGVNAGQGAVEGIQNWTAQNKEAAEESEKRGSLQAQGEGLYKQMVDAKNQQNNENERLQQSATQMAETSRHNMADEARATAALEQGKYSPLPSGQVLNTKTGDITGQNMFNSMTGATTDASGKTLTGDAYKAELTKTNPALATNAQKVVDGDFQITQYMLTRAPQLYMPMWNAAQQIDPTVSEQRYGYKQEFLKGNSPDAKNIDTFNTVGGHLQTIEQAARALDNNDTRALNAIQNSWKEQMGSPLPTNLDAAKTMVAGELVKAVTGAGGVSDRDKYEKEFSDRASQGQLLGAVDETKQLINQRINSAAYRYGNTVGGDYRKNLLPDVRNYLNTPAGATPPSAAAIEHLKANPTLAPQFEQKYGVKANQYLQ